MIRVKKNDTISPKVQISSRTKNKNKKTVLSQAASFGVTDSYSGPQ